MSRPIFFLALSLIVLAISASTSAASAVPTDIEEDSRPFLKTFPQKHQDDSSVFSRVLQSLKFRGNDRNEYGECEGDCDRDRDCASGLKCFQRDGLKSVPGCRGDGIRDVDYCVADKDDNGDDDDDDDDDDKPSNLGKNFDELTEVSNGDKGHGKCSGDCDDDDDCKDGLKCFSRSDNEDVPGCKGSGNKGTDYCYDPDDEVPRNSDELTIVKNVDEYGRCQGQCDGNSDCRNDLICFSAPDSVGKVPGCGGQRDGKSFCMDGDDLPDEADVLTVIDVSADIGRCYGDCNGNDGRCMGNLVCLDPKGESVVPGCGGTAESGVTYCVDPNDLPAAPVEETADVGVVTSKPTKAPTAPPTSKPTKAPTSKPTKSPTAKPTKSPTRKPSKAPTEAEVTDDPIETEATDDPTESPTRSPVVPEVLEPEDVGVAVPPFVVGVSFLTPTRRLKASVRLLIIAQNIEEDEDLTEIVEGLVGQRMFALYPETYQDVDLDAEFLDEVESDGITTVYYSFSGQATFLDDNTGNLPRTTDIKSATMEALDGTALTDQLIWSGDPVLEAVQRTAVMQPGDLDVSVSSETPTEPPPNSQDGSVPVVTIILVAVIVACVLILGIGFIFLRRSRRQAADKLVSHMPGQHGNGDLSASTSKKNSSPEGGTGILPSPTKTQALGDSYERSDIGDYSLSEMNSVSNADMDSVMDSSIGRSDWSVDGGNMASGYSTADESSLQAGGAGPLFARRNVEMTGTLRSLEEVEVENGAQRERAGSDAESSTLTDNASALGEVKLGSVLQVDEVDGQKDGEDFKKVWRASSGDDAPEQAPAKEIDPKKMYGIQFDGDGASDQDTDSITRKKSDAEDVLNEMVGMLNPMTAVPIATGTVQDTSINTISEAATDDEQSQSGGSIIGSILGLLPSGQPDNKEEYSIASEETGDQ